MKILVYGAGAVGGYLGGMLAHHGNEVTMIVRPDTAGIIESTGLVLSGPKREEIRVHPEIVPSVRRAFLDDRTYDLMLLTMKSYDVAKALNPLIAFGVKPYPPIVTLQNGIGIEEMVKETLGTEDVIAASLTTPLSRQSLERVQVEQADRGLALAPTRRKQRIKQWIKMFRDAGIETGGIRDYRSMKWSKALVNMIGNATSAILNRHPRSIYKYTPTFDLEMEMLSETMTVMDKMKLSVVDLPGVTIKRLALAEKLPAMIVKPILSRLVAEGRGNKMPSFHIDLTSGRQDNEVIYHNGAVVAAGKELDIPTPVNAALTDILLKIARGEIDWQIYDGNLTRLVKDVERYRRAA